MEKVSDRHITGIIPARYASTRFPGKPLALIGGKPMIRLVYEQASAALSSVYVATDDYRIYDTVRDFGGNAVMTSTDHRSGTDRCAEAAGIIEKETGKAPETIINIQGDEPFIRPEQISLLASCFDDENVKIATLIRKVSKDEDLFNINHPKVVVSLSGNAIYFSRSVIPFLRGEKQEEWASKHTYYKHLGIYGYKMETLLRLTLLQPGPLEIAESLEQNRWLENGFSIRTAVTRWESIGIDTPQDLENARVFLAGSGNLKK
jgi:3-deoxy-manno-octulosonate cytidylyltransferase (CMP-KDO synthetase)